MSKYRTPTQCNLRRGKEKEKNSKEEGKGREETPLFPESQVDMRSKLMNRIDDLSTDAEASDIISEAEFGASVTAPPRVHKNDSSSNDENALGPEWSGDPWSSDPWKHSQWADSSNNHQSRVETSFESLQFTPVIKTSGENSELFTPVIKTSGENSELFDFVDAFGAPFGFTDATTAPPSAGPSAPPNGPPSGGNMPSGSIPNGSIANSSVTTLKRGTTSKPKPIIVKESKINVGVVVKERLSIIFDEATNDPLCKVIGSIYVKPTKRRISSFALTIRDSRNHVEHWDERNSRCRNITAAVPHLALDSGDQVFSVSMNREHQQDQELDAPVVSYTCIPRLRPMPMLLKTKTHQKSDRCRLGVRIRANPQNTYALNDIVVLIVVPLGFDGENVTMSRRGGVWNDLKRSLVWNIPKLEPGEIIDIQAQFKTNMEESPAGDESHKFAVLARCNGVTNFSKIELNTDYNEDGSCLVGMDLKRSATILYRKI